MDENKYIICPNVEMTVASDNEVFVRNHNKIYSLKGNIVKNYLIPLLPSLEEGISLKEFGRYGDEDKIIKGVIEPLVKQNILKKSCDEEKSLDLLDSNVVELLSSKHIALITNESLFKRVKNIFRQYFANVDLIDPFSNVKNFLSNDNMSRIKDEVLQYDYVVIIETANNRKYEDELNRVICATKVPGMFSCINQGSIQIGPTIFPDYTGCLECLRFRMINNSQFMDKLIPFSQGEVYGSIDCSQFNARVDEGTLMAGVGHIIFELIRIVLVDNGLESDKITTKLPLSIESVIDIDLLSGTREINQFLKNPKCPVCNEKIYEWPENNAWMESYSFDLGEE